MSESRGFTLIELLVVIAIIGVLSSVIIASLNTARLKAADGSVRSEAEQLRNIMALEYSDTGSYAAIKNGNGASWVPAATTCSGFTGNYAAQAANICTALVKATGSLCVGNCVWVAATSPDSNDKFSIMAYLPSASAQAGAARYFCLGSGGKSSSVGNSLNGWVDTGCFANP